MANHDRTEKATPKHRSEARKKGQVAKSQDLNTAVVLTVGLIMVFATGSTIFHATGAFMTDTFALAAHPGEATTAAGLNGQVQSIISLLLGTVAPIAFACLAAGVVASATSTGLNVSTYALKPNPGRLNPINGAKNHFGSRMPFELGKSLAKVAVVGAAAAMVLVPMITAPAASIGVSPGDLGALITGSLRALVERILAAYLLIGIVDLVWQKRKMEKSLKMTKQQVREEAKQYSLPPEIRSAIRRRMIQAARARMMAAVPNADVVVTNPTHYAVALVYDGTKVAPEVVAKGQDLVAAQIRRIAEEHGVPIVPDPPLARALHSSVELGQLVPEELWGAVAGVLAFVYRVAGRRRVA
ncbi:MAG: flagellar biosynthesis protein FlhB [Solirubrobacteraceae bacterium]